MEVGGKYGFRIDGDRLDNILKRAYNAIVNKTGIFERGSERFLPQYALPSELEYNPKRKEVKNPETAAKYLWACAFFERLSQSRVIIRNAQATWNSNRNWIFYAEKVIDRKVEDVEKVLKEDFQFALQGINEASPGERFHYNAQKLVNQYDGDPRNLVSNLNVVDAREKIMEFKGIGSGIANLFIMYLFDREIAKPNDPEELLFKVDIHKSRIPVNTNAVRPAGDEIRRGQLSTALEEAYCASGKRLNIDPSMTDRALWIIGSELCAQQDYNACHLCPLEKICQSNVMEDQKTGRLIVYEKGKRVDTRKNLGQMPLLLFDS